MSPFTWNLCLKWPTPFEKSRLWPISAYSISTVRASEKCSVIANRKLTTRTLPLTPPKGGSKSEFVIFVIKFKFSWIKSATKFLCLKTYSSKVVVEPFPYLMVLAVNLIFRPKVTHPLQQRRFWRINTSVVRVSGKCSIITYRMSTVSFSTS